MQFIKSDINIDFVGKRKIAFIISLTMIYVSIASLLIHRGPRYGIDFAGGTLIQVKFKAPTSLKKIKSGLATIDLGKSSVQQFGDQNDYEYLIRTDRSSMTTQGFSSKVKTARPFAPGGSLSRSIEKSRRRISIVCLCTIESGTNSQALWVVHRAQGSLGGIALTCHLDLVASVPDELGRHTCFALY